MLSWLHNLGDKLNHFVINLRKSLLKMGEECLIDFSRSVRCNSSSEESIPQRFGGVEKCTNGGVGTNCT